MPADTFPELLYEPCLLLPLLSGVVSVCIKHAHSLLTKPTHCDPLLQPRLPVLPTAPASAASISGPGRKASPLYHSPSCRRVLSAKSADVFFQAEGSDLLYQHVSPKPPTSARSGSVRSLRSEATRANPAARARAALQAAPVHPPATVPEQARAPQLLPVRVGGDSVQLCHVQPAALDSMQCVRAGSEVSVTVQLSPAESASCMLRCLVLATSAGRILVDTEVELKLQLPRTPFSTHQFTVTIPPLPPSMIGNLAACCCACLLVCAMS
uniref:Uncharacterized protein n=1 Tax=Dunaliella viridis TaxID=140095 RepID=C8XTB5_9CHLO|nr:hypothetical protein [Dunaliella viridis]